MSRQDSICPLTGESTTIYQEGSAMVFNYTTHATGRVRYTDLAGMAFPSLDKEQKQILAGICRNRSIKEEEPILINQALVQKLYDQDIPYSFDDRVRHLLQYLYDEGGKKERRTHDMFSTSDCPIVYSSPEQFEKIVAELETEDLVTYNKREPTMSGTFYLSLGITKKGIQEIEKNIPKMPLFAIVDQKIYTGDAAIDAQIEHARILFFGEHSTMESKRSACETLSFVLEPLRKAAFPNFTVNTSAFFDIVNNFTVRHNTPGTRPIEHPEQFEWIFYGLLNTINIVYKMKRKLGS